MSEHPRLPCCIVGCGRTFKRRAGETVTMCARHLRADAEMYAWFKRAMKRYRRLERRCRREMGFIPGPTSRPLPRTNRWHTVLTAASKRTWAIWYMIKAKAQQMQDEGYWARRPRARKATVRKKRTVDRVANAFDANFQRLKAMQAGAR